jgi:hypothetical protein
MAMTIMLLAETIAKTIKHDEESCHVIQNIIFTTLFSAAISLFFFLQQVSANLTISLWEKHASHSTLIKILLSYVFAKSMLIFSFICDNFTLQNIVD